MIASHTLLALALQAPALHYEPPAGWTRTLDPRTAVTTLMPSRLPPGQVAVVTVFSAEPFAGSAREYHAEIVRRAMSSARLLEPPQSVADSSPGGSGGGGRSSTRAHVLMPNGAEVWITVYTVRWGRQGQAFLLTANTADLAKQYGPAADAMIAGIRVPEDPRGLATRPADAGVAAPPPCYRPTGIEICPMAVVPDEPSTRIVGAFIAAAARSSFSVGEGVRSRVSTDVLLLFANGVAVRSAATKAGGDTYWAEGFATMDPRDPARIGARRVGRWSEQHGVVTIAWQIGAPQTLARDGENLRDRYTSWAPYPAVDGLRLEGRYQRVEAYATPWTIMFSRDGRFEASGVNNAMGGSTVNPGFPERGAGSYEIRKWSLILRFDTGFVQSINLLVGAGEGELVLNGYTLRRS